jgi:hypothetical protein
LGDSSWWHNCRPAFKKLAECSFTKLSLKDGQSMILLLIWVSCLIWSDAFG